MGSTGTGGSTNTGGRKGRREQRGGEQGHRWEEGAPVSGAQAPGEGVGGGGAGSTDTGVGSTGTGVGARALRGEHGHWGEHGHREPLTHRAPYLQVELIERVCQGVGVVLLVVLVVVLLCRHRRGRDGKCHPRGCAQGAQKPRCRPLRTPPPPGPVCVRLLSALTIFTRGKNVGQELASQAVLLLLILLVLVLPHVVGVVCLEMRSSWHAPPLPPDWPGRKAPRVPAPRP